MIFVSIFGGLGNQMFQFAAAYSLSLEKNTPLALSFDRMNRSMHTPGFTRRDFELDSVFNLPSYQVAGEQELHYILNPEPNFFQRLRRKVTGAKAFYEQGLQYDSAIHSLGKETYLEGYFQSIRYFESYQAAVLKIFQFRQHASPKTEQLFQDVAGLTTVAVHVRRGDFVSSEANLKTHGVCMPSYYEEAARHFETDNNVCFVVVSDDPAWVKANIRLGQKTVYADWNHGADSWQDMLIISKCSHAIIANSSFSWWGAMLIASENKKIIAPARWYADSKLQQQTTDLIPASWIKI